MLHSKDEATIYSVVQRKDRAHPPASMGRAPFISPAVAWSPFSCAQLSYPPNPETRQDATQTQARAFAGRALREQRSLPDLLTPSPLYP
jgi:hypothetical protein